MRRTLCALLVASLIIAGCGGRPIVRGAFPPGNAVIASGFISTIEFTSIPDLSGNLIDATIVTLVQPDFDFFSEITFCGDAVGFFPFDTFVDVEFVPANPCVVSFTVDVSIDI
jgi:hypothetical protein